jgi:hypothetical protein
MTRYLWESDPSEAWPVGAMTACRPMDQNAARIGGDDLPAAAKFTLKQAIAGHRGFQLTRRRKNC